ncbi:unnamed protein product [Ceratitis capitata]|uniref:(Mediterranean fruit fly) hypothetical protein n=1 Tax=Ceratitis capitata TaxID=7213 RepID=A0A811U5X8_CERCA|nr:unnamed protein product [Ceratitis capitata]
MYECCKSTCCSVTATTILGRCTTKQTLDARAINITPTKHTTTRSQLDKNIYLASPWDTAKRQLLVTDRRPLFSKRLHLWNNKMSNIVAEVGGEKTLNAVKLSILPPVWVYCKCCTINSICA